MRRCLSIMKYFQPGTPRLQGQTGREGKKTFKKKSLLTVIGAVIISTSMLSVFFSVLFAWDLTEEFIDKKNGYKIKYPSSWNFKNHPHSRNLVKADINNKNNSAGLQIRIYKAGQITFDRFVDNYVSNFIKEMQRTEVIVQKPATIGGISGYIISFDARQRNGYFLKSYLIPWRDIIYVFQSGTAFENRASIEPILDAIAGSFEINPP